MSAYKPVLQFLVDSGEIPKATRKAFLETSFTPARLVEIADLAGYWTLQKLCLLHKDCPDQMTEAYLQSPIWYIRLTAALSQHKREKYLTRLYDDKKSTVRAAAIKTAHGLGWLSAAEMADRVKADQYIQNYFRGYE